MKTCYIVSLSISFCMPRGAKNEYDPPMNLNRLLALHSTLNTSSKHAPSQVERNYICCMQNYQWKIIGNRLLTKSPTKGKDEL